MNAQFEKNGYIVYKNFLPEDFCKFAQSYYKIRQDSLDYDIDEQCPRSKSFYSDPLCETLLQTSCEKISNIVNVDLIPTYSYTRIYGKKEHLTKHIDRPECQFSVTINLGYPKSQGISSIFMSKNEDGSDASELKLDVGDICIYRGDTVYHWREPFIQDWYLQTFLHYVEKNGMYGNRLYDGRFSLGTPKYFSGI